MKNYYNYRYGSFHSVSKDTFYWIQDMPYVKEESITDRIIYNLNRNNRYVICHEFSRNKEAVNGADWEWWILYNREGSDYNGVGQYNDVLALRYRMQAKKLARDRRDNYHLFQYANRNGLQIDLLREQAAKDKAYAVYSLYSDCKRTNEDITLEFCKQTLPNICSNCRNGIFFVSANKIYKDYITPGKTVIYREDIVNQSLPASILDFFITEVHHYHYDRDVYIKNSYHDWIQEKDLKRIIKATYLMRYGQENIHEYKDFPHYLKALILDKDNKREASRQKNRVQENYWEEYERIESTTLSGVGIIDLRRKCINEQ